MDCTCVGVAAARNHTVILSKGYVNSYNMHRERGGGGGGKRSSQY